MLAKGRLINLWKGWKKKNGIPIRIISIVCNNKVVCASKGIVATPFLEECEDDTHTLEMGTWKSSEIPKTSEFDCRGQNTLHWGVLYVIRKISKCRCRKWPHMSHLDICSTRYGKKKGRESNWQFDSRPLKVGNQLDPGVCRWSATHRWKSLEESYKFALDFSPIEGLSKELWAHKVLGAQIGTVSRLLLGSLGTKKTIRM